MTRASTLSSAPSATKTARSRSRPGTTSEINRPEARSSRAHPAPAASAPAASALAGPAEGATPADTPFVDVSPAAVAGALQPVSVGDRPLRLLTTPEGLVRLRAAALVTGQARGRGSNARLEARYFDTADHALFARGMSLRVQRRGRRFTQTLKRHAGWQGDEAGLVWQTSVPAWEPELQMLTGVGVPPELVHRLMAEPLACVFETRLHRRLLRLDLPHASLDLAFDDGEIIAGAEAGTGGGAQPVAELRLAAREGRREAVYELAMRLSEISPLRLSPGTVRRGYALASPRPPRAEKAAASGLKPDGTLDDAIAGILGGCQAHLLANQLVAEDGRSAEGVHQARVALRRLRTALSLLGREVPQVTMPALADEAKWIADALGPARGWDVFLATTLTRPEQHATRGADFGRLREAARGLREESYGTVREVLAAPRYARFQLSLAGWVARRGWRNDVAPGSLAVLAEPAGRVALRVLNRLHRQALRRGAGFGQLSAADRHRLRITLKKLRYATEFFTPLFIDPDAARRYVGRIGELQDALGLAQDSATTAPLLEALGAGSVHPGLQQAVGMVAGWQAHERLSGGGRLRKRWRQFKAHAPFWVRDEAWREPAPPEANAGTGSHPATVPCGVPAPKPGIAIESL